MPKQFRFRFALALATVVSLGLISQPFFWRVGAARSVASAPTLLAPSLEVMSMEDSGPGSLRAAIEAANSSPADDVITFAINGTITLTSSELTIASVASGGKLTINGNGVSQTIISGNNATRVFNVSSGAEATLTHLTIEKGKTGYYGGGINNTGSLTLTQCVVTGNSVTDFGGGIYNMGTLTLSYSTVSNNSNSGDYYNYGGGIYSDGGTINLLNSTVTGNTASGSMRSYGGGIYGTGTLRMTNSTISGNRVSNGGARGGGIFWINGNPIASNCTITDNSASGESALGGGILNTGTLQSRNTIIAGNTVSGQRDNLGPDVRGTLDSQGFNLIGNNADATINAADGDQIGTPDNPINPQLAPLANNGGPTQTHALLPNSPARERGDNCVVTNTCASPNPGFALTTDQRGTPFNRLVGNRVDIGAVEYNAAPTLNVEAVTIAQGSLRNNVLLGLAGDLEQAPETLSVSLTPLTGFGVTLGTISLDSSGNIKANVSATCGATTSTFTLKVTDNGTLFDEQTLTVSVTPDAIRPDTNLTGMPGAVSDVNVSFTFSGTDNCGVSGFQCKLDAGGWTNCSSGQSYSTLSSGQHTFQVKAIDAAGNEDATPASYTWTVFAASCGTVVNPATMPAATKGVPFVQTLSAAPTGSYVFSLLSGTLPPGVSLVNTLGIYSLRGTPTTSGSYTFTLRAKKNNSTCEGARTYTINVP